MASWTQAKKWLREGKKICRPIWDHESYWCCDNEKQRINFSDGQPVKIFLQQLTEKDWEIFKTNLPEINIIQCPTCGMADVWVNRVKKMDFKTKFCKCLK